MKTTFLSLLFATLSIAAFSQKANSKKPAFEVISSDHITVSKDSTIITMTGNVDIKGEKFHFHNAEKVVHNKKENILLVYGGNTVNADSLTLVKGDDGKEYIRYKL